jgi:hypothetical protein
MKKLFRIRRLLEDIFSLGIPVKLQSRITHVAVATLANSTRKGMSYEWARFQNDFVLQKLFSEYTPVPLISWCIVNTIHMLVAMINLKRFSEGSSVVNKVSLTDYNRRIP